MLGRVGNTGQSTGPHLHVHVDTTGEDGGLRLLHFRNIRTRFAGVDWDESPACATSATARSPREEASASWRLRRAAVAGGRGRADEVRAARDVQDYGDEAVASGYKPVWFDGYDVGGKAYVNVASPAGRRRLGAAQRPDEGRLPGSGHRLGREGLPARRTSRATAPATRSGTPSSRRRARPRGRGSPPTTRTAAQHQQPANQLKGRATRRWPSRSSRSGKLSYTAPGQSSRRAAGCSPRRSSATTTSTGSR